MASSKIIHQETIPIRVTAFERFPIKAAVDRGSSLTKIAFVSKDTPSNAGIIQLQCVTFLNEDFIEAVQYLKDNAKLPTEGSLHVTGVGGATYRDQIKKITGLDVTFINEMVTIGYGPYLFVSNCEPGDIFFPIPNYRKLKIESKMLDNVMKINADEASKSESKFPALILYVGSGCGMMKVDENGKGSFISGSAVAGKPLMGLAHALCGTADYNELMKLAEKGDNNKADMTVGDLIKDDPESPYGRFDPEMPAFSFGKASHKSWDKESCQPADYAASLLTLLSGEMATMALVTVMNTGIKKIYVSGNVFRNELPRKLFYERFMSKAEKFGIEVKFLKTGHGGALATMFLEPEDCDELLY